MRYNVWTDTCRVLTKNKPLFTPFLKEIKEIRIKLTRLVDYIKMKGFYYMASSVGGQDKLNPGL